MPKSPIHFMRCDNGTYCYLFSRELNFLKFERTYFAGLKFRDLLKTKKYWLNWLLFSKAIVSNDIEQNHITLKRNWKQFDMFLDNKTELYRLLFSGHRSLTRSKTQIASTCANCWWTLSISWNGSSGGWAYSPFTTLAIPAFSHLGNVA